MANRAYLYSADSPDAWERPDEDYHDSRWAIPLAWFFFFRPANVRRVDVEYHGSSWQEVKLAAEKGPALDLFARREQLLLSLIGGRVEKAVVEDLPANFTARAGRFLLLDPEEVLGGMSEGGEWHAERFGRILALLDSGRGDEVLSAAYPYVGPLDRDPERCRGQVVGYTYW